MVLSSNDKFGGSTGNPNRRGIACEVEDALSGHLGTWDLHQNGGCEVGDIMGII